MEIYRSLLATPTFDLCASLRFFAKFSQIMTSLSLSLVGSAYTHDVTLPARAHPPQAPRPPLRPLARSVPSSLSLAYLPRFPRLSHTILSVSRPFPHLDARSYSPSPFSSSLGPPTPDGNPRCPPTDTNGYLCQRRNLLLYIPLYKQRVNRAHTLRAPRMGGRAPRSTLSLTLFLAPLLFLSPASSHQLPVPARVRQVRRGYPIYAPWKPIYRSFRG